MRCPSSPGKGGLSNPGSSRPNLTHITVRGMMITPGRCYVVLYSEYYKIACRMSNSTRSTPRLFESRVSVAAMRGLLGRPQGSPPPLCTTPALTMIDNRDERLSKNPESGRPPRIIFLGMQGNFSHPPLRAVLEAGIEVCAVVVPAAQGLVQHELPAIRRREQPQAFRSPLTVLESSLHTSILQLAWERHIPRAMLDIARLGCLNVHPSLLPANRGPEPLFWTFREGSRRTGVTIHLMDEGMDTGPIVAQETLEVPDGISYAQLETQCAMLGGRLLARSVWDLYDELAIPVAQDETKSSYHGFPTDDDFAVPVAEWSARHVYNFIGGVA